MKNFLLLSDSHFGVEGYYSKKDLARLRYWFFRMSRANDKALKKACEFIGDYTGSCPLDLCDWDKCPAILYDANYCNNQYLECWVNYFRGCVS